MILAAYRHWRDEAKYFWLHLLKRSRAESGTVSLNQRRVYIIPTRSGFVFALVLLAMLIGAINYQNSLAFLLTFLLGGLAVVSMVHATRNLVGLRILAGHPRPAFAGEQARFPISVESPLGQRRIALKIYLPDQPPLTFDLEENGGRWLELPFPSETRGYLSPGRITLYSRFPLGLFHAWSYIHLAMPCLIYPRPDNEHDLPPLSAQEQGPGDSRGRGNDDFTSLRPYHVGDSMRHVHWKALAREQGMLTKQFGGGGNEELWLHWDLLGNLGVEARLSRLARQVLDADGLGLAYGLAIPDRIIPPSRGDGHRHRCLEALALFGMKDTGDADRGL
jgi:uncharacterized protein (DUF58 family)